jgi:hypothetical protein
MWFYFALFFLIGFFCIKKTQNEYHSVAFLTFVLIVVAAIRGPIDNDYLQYKIFYENALRGNMLVPEISFYWFSNLGNYVFSNIGFLFLFYAIMGVSIKIVAIKELSEFWFFSILIYFSYFFILHEMTQIRVGVAIGFILISIKHIQDQNIKWFLLTVLLASFFHYSALIILPFYFLNPNKIEFKYYLLIPIGYLLFVFELSPLKIISMLNINILIEKFKFYEPLAMKHPLNVFSFFQLFRCLFCVVLLWKWQVLQLKNKYAVILIKLYIFSCFFLVAFSDIPPFASRFSEMFASVEIILIPFLLYLIPNREKAVLLIFSIALTMLSITLFYSSLLKDYTTILERNKESIKIDDRYNSSDN